MPESLSYPFWICMKGRSKSGGKLFGIARTEKEMQAWKRGSASNWCCEVDKDDDIFAEGITGFQEDAE